MKRKNTALRPYQKAIDRIKTLAVMPVGFGHTVILSELPTTGPTIADLICDGYLPPLKGGDQ